MGAILSIRDPDKQRSLRRSWINSLTDVCLFLWLLTIHPDTFLNPFLLVLSSPLIFTLPCLFPLHPILVPSFSLSSCCLFFPHSALLAPPIIALLSIKASELLAQGWNIPGVLEVEPREVGVQGGTLVGYIVIDSTLQSSHFLQGN